MDWFSSPIFITNLLFNTTHGENLIKIRLKVEITLCSSVGLILLPVKDTLPLLILNIWKCAWISPAMHNFNYNCFRPCVYRTWLQVTWLCTNSNQARNRNMYFYELNSKPQWVWDIEKKLKPRGTQTYIRPVMRAWWYICAQPITLQRCAASKIKQPVYAH